jgi:hypothetical protein
MRNERLTILLSPKEKRRIVSAAEKSGLSAGEWVRSRVLTEREAGLGPIPSPEEIRILEAAAEAALASFKRANDSLDRAFAEIEATKKYFAARRKNRS